MPTEARSVWRHHPISSLSLTMPSRTCSLVCTRKSGKNKCYDVWSTFLDKCNTLNVFFCRSAESVCLDHVSLNLMVLSWMIQHYVESSTLSKIWPHKNFMKNQTMEKNSKLPHFHTQWRIRCWKDCEHQTCHPVLCYHRSGFWQEEGPSPWKDSGMLQKT